ncbi:MAG TPA: hypothetical protein VL484_17145, partial [Vicinamibacterales bacterium]|nr:hypothetical protein [Vicinamibacterales bacterium]
LQTVYNAPDAAAIKIEVHRVDGKQVCTMFARELHQAGHTKRFSISANTEHGWEVREEQDSEVLKRVWYSDWHRVERAMQAFVQQIDELEDRGWSTS